MTVVTPPLFQNIDATYTAADLGLPYRDFLAEGVVGSTAMAVSERGAGANMSVDVAAGVAWVKGDDSALQPTYRCYNDGTVNLTVTAADGSNPRIDIVIAEVRDAAFSGVSTDWRLRVVAGTPAGSPSVPATPNNAVKLAEVSVPAADTTIGTAQITDTRPRASLAGSMNVPLVTELPTAAQRYDGQVVDLQTSGMETLGIVWRFRYDDNGGSPVTYPWYFVGGGPMAGEAVPGSSRSNAAWGDLVAGAGPSLTVERFGVFLVHFGGNIYQTVSGTGQIGVSVGGVDPAAGTFIDQQVTISGISHARQVKLTVASGTKTLQLKAKSSGAGPTVNVNDWQISALPLQVA